MKQRILQACSLKDSIKRGIFSVVDIRTYLGQTGGSPPPPTPPHLATRLSFHSFRHAKKTVFYIRIVK